MNSNGFFNEFAANPQNLGVLAGAVGVVLAAFGIIYNLVMNRRQDKVYTAIYVVGGVLVTLAGVAIISWKAAVLCLIAFAASGLPMVIGDMARSTRMQAREDNGHRRRRLPYADKGLADEALMSASNAQRDLSEILSKKDQRIEEIMRLVGWAGMSLARTIQNLSEIGR